MLLNIYNKVKLLKKLKNMNKLIKENFNIKILRM